MEYRVYLLDGADNVVAAEVFLAAHDLEAGEIALSLHAACSDVYATCEVWRGGKCIITSAHASLQRWNATLEQMRRGREERLLELEEALESSFDCMRSEEHTSEL